MNTEVISVLEWVFNGLVSIILLMGGWVWAANVKRIDDNEKELLEQRKLLADFKLYVANTYSRSDAIERISNEIKSEIKELNRLIMDMWKDNNKTGEK